MYCNINPFTFSGDISVVQSMLRYSFSALIHTIAAFQVSKQHVI